jgi:hypothetical protein
VCAFRHATSRRGDQCPERGSSGARATSSTGAGHTEDGGRIGVWWSRIRCWAVSTLYTIAILGLLGPAQMGEGWDALRHGDCGGPLPAAHAHNDMDNGRPLVDALAHGFTSVEADVWLTDGSLRVGHWPKDASSLGNTLERLYLRPLQTRMSRPSGAAAGSGPLFLLLDIKTSPFETVQVLGRLLDRYPSLVPVGSMVAAAPYPPVRVIVSSHQPGLAVAAASDPRLRVDRRPAGGAPHDLVGPGRRGDWLSVRWSWHFNWDGIGPMPVDEFRRLREMASMANRRGQQLRVWGTPGLPGARENVWSQTLRAGVDRISTDDLSALSRFLRSRGECSTV